MIDLRYKKVNISFSTGIILNCSLTAISVIYGQSILVANEQLLVYNFSVDVSFVFADAGMGCWTQSSLYVA